MKKTSDRESSHLPPRSSGRLQPRKSPVQARSSASADAILEAGIQVLLPVGKERLTTTRVALRARASTSFPNKSALLQAALKCHLDDITETAERVCRSGRARMATARIDDALRHELIIFACAYLDAFSGLPATNVRSSAR